MPTIWRLVGLHRSEEHTSELQSHSDLVCRLLLEKKKLGDPGQEVLDVVDPDVRHGRLTSRRHVLVVLLRVAIGPICVVVVASGYLFLILRFFVFFNDPATTEIYTLSLHDALPIYPAARWCLSLRPRSWPTQFHANHLAVGWTP